MKFKKALKVFGMAVFTVTVFVLGVYEGLAYAKAERELEEEMEAFEKSLQTPCESKDNSNPGPA